MELSKLLYFKTWGRVRCLWNLTPIVHIDEFKGSTKTSSLVELRPGVYHRSLVSDVSQGWKASHIDLVFLSQLSYDWDGLRRTVEVRCGECRGPFLSRLWSERRRVGISIRFEKWCKIRWTLPGYTNVGCRDGVSCVTFVPILNFLVFTWNGHKFIKGANLFLFFCHKFMFVFFGPRANNQTRRRRKAQPIISSLSPEDSFWGRLVQRDTSSVVSLVRSKEDWRVSSV